MIQKERSSRSREHILDAALHLFAHQGYRGTNLRDVARAAELSTGNVYHLFPDKESIFRALLERYFAIVASPEYPFNKALAEGAFPDDLEKLGRAARQSVERYRDYVALVYVDVVEFEGSHIRRFYSEMAQRFEGFLATNPLGKDLARRLRPGVSPVHAIMLVTRFFLQYYAVEVVFGVPNHFGQDADAVTRDIADILKRGMLREAPAKAARSRRSAGRRPA
jgi:AcrR family transcriptional regulator